MELSEFFTFFVPGYQFVPAYRNRIWDGKIRLFALQSGQIYLGLVPYLKEFCAEREYTYEIEELTDEYSVYLAEKFIKTLNLHSNGKPIEVREHQLNAYVHAMRNRRALLLSPTASGKSLIIYLLFRQLLDYQNLKGLVIVPTTSLVEQLYSDFADYSSEDNFDVDSAIHRIYQGKAKESDKSLLISTWQSLYQMDKSYFEQFDYIIGDEAHLFKAKSLTGILNKCTITPYRIGTTGTLDGTKTHKLVLEGLFGPVYKVTTTKKLITEKTLADLKIYNIILEYPDEIRKIVKGMSYHDEMDFIVQYPARNKFIRNLALDQKGNTLVLFQFVEKHGKLLYDMIWAKCEDRQVFFVYGGTDTEQRELVRQLTEKENDAIIVASYGTFSTGVNVKNLHNIIFASPTKSRIRNLQSIGRGLRTSETKKACNLYDIGDDLSWKNKKNYTLLHMIERIKIYNDEHFNYRLIKVPLR